MFKITARSLLELGSELISSDIIAFYELIKNGFDAKTTKDFGVEITFDIVLRKNKYIQISDLFQKIDVSDQTIKSTIRASLMAPSSAYDSAMEILNSSNSRLELKNALDQINAMNSITVVDAGSGMSLDDLNKSFLVIGTPSRKHSIDDAILSGAKTTPYLGEKGIGRLSAMRLGEYLEVQSAKKEDTNFNVLKIDWRSFSDLNAMLDEIDIEPYAGELKPNPEWSGTRIIIRDLSEDWTHERVSRMVEYDVSKLTDPFLDPKNRPKITFFWNGQRLLPSWMPSELIQSAHAKVSGSYEYINGEPQLSCLVEIYNLGFDHPVEFEKSVITLIDLKSLLAGTRQEIPETALYKVGPFKFEAYWYNRRRLQAIEGVGNLKQVRGMQEKWSGIMLFRDEFRVFPYGDDEDDWLALDRKALRRSGYLLNKDQFVGRVQISRIANPNLLDQTNREGLRETPEQQVFLSVMKLIIQDKLFNFIGHVERQYKGQKFSSQDAKTEVKELEKRAKNAITQLRKHVPTEYKNTVEDLEQLLYQFSNVNEDAQQRVDQIENENRQMVEMAGIGLMIEVVAHELARVSENALDNLDDLRKNKNVPDEIRKTLSSLQSQMRSLSKRIKILDPMSVSGRQRFEVFTLDEMLEEILEAHTGQFERHNIKFVIEPASMPVRVKAVKGMIIQIIENLISNSKYWMEMRKVNQNIEQPTIRITLHNSPPAIVYQDNGYGIAPDNKDKIFAIFFSLKEKTKRRGLGLFIARECAAYNGGSLELDDEVSKETGRLHKFVLELPVAEGV